MRTIAEEMTVLLVGVLINIGCSSTSVGLDCASIAAVVKNESSIDDIQRQTDSLLGPATTSYLWGGPVTTESITLVYGDSLTITLFTKPVRNDQFVMPGKVRSEEHSMRRYIDERVVGYIVAKRKGDEVKCEYRSGDTESLIRFK